LPDATTYIEIHMYVDATLLSSSFKWKLNKRLRKKLHKHFFFQGVYYNWVTKKQLENR